MTLRTVIKNIIKRLKLKFIATADLDALIIAKTAIGRDDIFIMTHPEYKPTQEELKTMEKFTQMREKLYPISYIKNSKEFYGIEFYVDENVLIPRPETEMLVDEVLNLSKQFRKPKIVDVGTGSGAIAVTLSKKTGLSITASDISYKALSIAKKNAENIGASVEFIQADTLSFLREKVDIIVSNPPYIDKNEYDFLQKDVKYEPKDALICEGGTEVLKKLIEQSRKLSTYLVLEIGYNQENFIRSFKHCIKIKKDPSNLPRVAIFRF